MKKFLTTAYGALAFLATGLALVIGLLFVTALVLGGSAASTLSESAGTVAEWSIYVAAAAILVGLVHIYASGSHSLTARTKPVKRDEPGDGAPGT